MIISNTGNAKTRWVPRSQPQFRYLFTVIFKGCTLSALFEALQDHFSREPPVYSKPKDDRPVSSTGNLPYAERAPPPVPSNAPSASNTPSPQRPALPSKPPSMVPAPAPAIAVQESSRPLVNVSFRLLHRRQSFSTIGCTFSSLHRPRLRHHFHLTLISDTVSLQIILPLARCLRLCNLSPSVVDIHRRSFNTLFRLRPRLS